MRGFRRFWDLTEHPLSDELGHSIIDCASRGDDVCCDTKLFCLVDKIEWIDTNTVATHEAGLKGKKIPFGSCCLKDFFRRYAEGVTEQGNFIHVSDIEIALCILDRFGHFGCFDVGSSMDSRSNNRSVEVAQ